MTMTSEIEHRLTRLETRAGYTDKILEDRQVVIAAHSRRLADIDQRMHNLTRVQGANAERLTAVENQTQTIHEEQRDERIRREHRRAIMQWMISILMGIGVIIGLLSQGEASLIGKLLGGFTALPS